MPGLFWKKPLRFELKVSSGFFQKALFFEKQKFWEAKMIANIIICAVIVFWAAFVLFRFFKKKKIEKKTGIPGGCSCCGSFKNGMCKSHCEK